MKLSTADTSDPQNVALLPAQLRELIERSQKLQLRIRRLDVTIHNANAVTGEQKLNPVEHQLGLLKAAFGA